MQVKTAAQCHEPPMMSSHCHCTDTDDMIHSKFMEKKNDTDDMIHSKFMRKKTDTDDMIHSKFMREKN